MKTRIVWTKIWEDDWFQSLSDGGQKLFLYLITNRIINLSGCYQVSDFIIKAQTRIKDLEKIKTELYPKVRFFKDYVYIPNAESYGGYYGEKNETAKKKELSDIPKEVINALFTLNNDRVSIPYRYSNDTSINHKSIINNTKKVKTYTDNNLTLQEVANNLLELFNKENKTNYSNTKVFIDNLAYWLEIHSYEKIANAIGQIKYDEFWKDKMKPETFFRQTSKGQPVDWIETILNSKKIKGNTSDELLKQIGL